MLLEELKKIGEAPEWMTEEGYRTISKGYLLEGETPRQMYTRVAKSANKYTKNKDCEDRFFEIMWKNWWCPASPVLSNMGAGRGLPISCFSIHPGDSLYSIMDKGSELGLMSQGGGGVGIFVGEPRSAGSPISGGGVAEGVIPWCKIYDSITSAVSQGCYDRDTEILTEAGWLSFESLKNNRDLKVYQSDTHGNISVTNFSDYIEHQVDEDLYRFSGKITCTDLLITGNHRVAFEKRRRVNNKRDKNGRYLDNTKKPDGFLSIESADKFKPHRDNSLWVSAKNCKGVLSSLSYEDMFKIAYQADGSTKPSSVKEDYAKYRFHFSKKRKIDRLLNILNNLKLNYTIKIENSGSTSIGVEVPKKISISKKLSDVFNISDFSKEYSLSFLNEIAFWDGNIRKKGGISYSCIVKENVDFVQAVSFISGKMSLSKSKEREGNRVTLHKIYISNRESVGGENIEVSRERYIGNVYCVTVPTGLLVVRRNGKVTICGNSTRRGASAVYLPIESKDINDFMNMRRPTGDVNSRCLNINHGVTITDKWMEEMLSGDQDKRELFIGGLNTRVETGEPFMMFTDNVNKVNPPMYKDLELEVVTSNICTEILLYTDPLHSFVCCLGSLNLMRYDEFINTDTIYYAQLMLDCVLEYFIDMAKDKPGYENAVRFAEKGRPVGVGVLGWHSLLQSRMIPFDSFDAMMLNGKVFKEIRKQADEASRRLAIEYGEPEWCKGYGYRNTHRMAIAPTTSNSLIAGGHSAGIEPWASNVFVQGSAKGTFIRKNKQFQALLFDYGRDDFETWRSIEKEQGSVQHLDFLTSQEKEVFLTAREINQMSLIKQAAQRQVYIDQGQSLNLFFAHDADPQYIYDVHIEAWKLGIKTLYYMRSEGVIKSKIDYKECRSCEG